MLYCPPFREGTTAGNAPRGSKQMSFEELEQLVRKGRAEPTKGIIDQTEYTAGLTAEKKAALLDCGLTEEQIVTLGSLRDELLQYIGTRGAAVVSAEEATREEERCVDLSKRHFRQLRLATPMAARKAAVTETDLKRLVPQVAVGRSTIRIIEHLTNSRETVAKLDDALKPYFRGESALAQHDALRAGLLAAQRNQETKATATPENTRALHLIKGRLLQLIEDINRIGQIAFPNEAETSSRFNKDILLRARGNTRSKKSETKQTEEDKG